MERGEPSLKPEWLLRPITVPASSVRPATSSRADDQGRGASSRNRSGRDRDRNSQQSSSRQGSGSSGSKRNDRDGSGKSRGYASFGRNNREKVQEKDPDSRLIQTEDSPREGFESFSSCRSEKDRLNRTRSKAGISNRTVGVSLDNGNNSRKDTGGISFEREFPHLGSEEKNGKQEIGRVPSPGISTPIQGIPLVNAPDVWNSVLAEVPVLDPSNNPVSSSLSPVISSKQIEVSNSGSSLSMAETVMQSPLKISTAPQLSIDAQKIEERTMRQCTLRPLTPSSSKTSVLSPFDKSRPKGARTGESNGPVKVAPQLTVQPSSSSGRAPVKTDLVKSSQSGSLQVLSREQNGIVNTAKDCTTNPVSPVLGRSSSMEPMRKPVVNQKLKVATNGLPLHLLQGSFGERKASAKDKHKFFELLRSKSVNGSSTTIESSSGLIDEQQSSCLDLPFNSEIKCIENGSSSCEEANSCEGSQRHLSDNEDVILPSESRDVLDEGSLGILADNRDGSSSVLADTEDVASEKPQPEKAKNILSIPAYINDGSIMSNSVDSEANFPFGPIVAEGEEAYPAQEFERTGAGEEELYPAQDKPSPEELAFLRSLGWDENEVVPPLQQEEIADCVRQNVRLQQKLQECRG
ncbi:hypothetical protein ACP70R_009722 [Stipagrostis hirtigluma subsp. patula]